MVYPKNWTTVLKGVRHSSSRVMLEIPARDATPPPGDPAGPPEAKIWTLFSKILRKYTQNVRLTRPIYPRSRRASGPFQRKETLYYTGAK